MFLSGFRKYFLLLLLAFCPSCGYWSNSSNTNVSPNQPEIKEIKSEIPFSSKEPDVYQAEIIERIEGEEEHRVFVARHGNRSFYRTGEMGGVRTGAGNSFSLLFSRKIYTELTAGSGAAADAAGETLGDFLTTEWLNQKTEAKFENLGPENGLTKYRVAFENSEALIFIDENLKLAVKQEFYSLDGGQRTLQTAIEVRNLKLETDETYFEIPKDFRKVTFEEFGKELKKGSGKEN